MLLVFRGLDTAEIFPSLFPAVQFLLPADRHLCLLAHRDGAVGHFQLLAVGAHFFFKGRMPSGAGRGARVQEGPFLLLSAPLSVEQLLVISTNALETTVLRC